MLYIVMNFIFVNTLIALGVRNRTGLFAFCEQTGQCFRRGSIHQLQ